MNLWHVNGERQDRWKASAEEEEWDECYMHTEELKISTYIASLFFKSLNVLGHILENKKNWPTYDDLISV